MPLRLPENPAYEVQVVGSSVATIRDDFRRFKEILWAYVPSTQSIYIGNQQDHRSMFRAAGLEESEVHYRHIGRAGKRSSSGGLLITSHYGYTHRRFYTELKSLDELNYFDIISSLGSFFNVDTSDYERLEASFQS